MGLINVQILLKNPLRRELDGVEVTALVDTACTYLCIPKALCELLRLETDEVLNVKLADGSRKPVPYVGPVEVSYKGRRGFCGALVMGNEVLLGAVPLEEMDLVIAPKTLSLEPNPKPIRI